MGIPTIDRNSTIRCSRETVATEVNQEIVLMSLERNRCYGLDTTGSDIWRKLATATLVADLVKELKDEYEDPSDQLEADVLRTLQEFAAEGLIEIGSSADSR